DSFLDRLGSLVDERLGLLQAEAGGRTDHLDRLDLLVAGSGDDHVEGGLLLGLRPAVGAGSGRRRRSRGDRGGRDAERFLERLDPLGELEHRDVLEFVDPLLRGRHASSFASDGSPSEAASVSVSSEDSVVTSGPGSEAGDASPLTSPCSATCCSWIARPEISAFRVRTSPDSGEAIVPTSWAYITSREGSRASERISSALSSAPFITPPLNSSVPSVLAASFRALAASAASPLMNVSAVGPSSIGLSISAPASSLARSVSEFLTTRKRASASRSLARRSATWDTEMPR